MKNYRAFLGNLGRGITSANAAGTVFAVSLTAASAVYTQYWSLKWILIALSFLLLLRLLSRLAPKLPGSTLVERSTEYRYLLPLVAAAFVSTYFYGVRTSVVAPLIHTYSELMRHGKDRYLNLVRYSNGKVSIQQIDQDRDRQSLDDQQLKKVYVPLHLIPLASCLEKMHHQFIVFDEVAVQFVEESSERNKDLANRERKEALAYLAQGTNSGVIADGKCDVVAQTFLKLDLSSISDVPSPAPSVRSTP